MQTSFLGALSLLPSFYVQLCVKTLIFEATIRWRIARMLPPMIFQCLPVFARIVFVRQTISGFFQLMEGHGLGAWIVREDSRSLNFKHVPGGRWRRVAMAGAEAANAA